MKPLAGENGRWMEEKVEIRCALVPNLRRRATNSVTIVPRGQGGSLGGEYL